MTMMRPIHPQAVRGEPQAVRWVVRTGVGQLVGEVQAAPGKLGAFMDDGIITRALLETEGVWTWLATGQRWTDWGHKVREAIADALEHDGWQIDAGSADLLGYVARDVVEGDFAGQGKTIQVVENDAHWVMLDLDEAAGETDLEVLERQQRVEAAIRVRYPLLQASSRMGDTGKRRFASSAMPRRALW